MGKREALASDLVNLCGSFTLQGGDRYSISMSDANRLVAACRAAAQDIRGRAQGAWTTDQSMVFLGVSEPKAVAARLRAGHDVAEEAAQMIERLASAALRAPEAADAGAVALSPALIGAMVAAMGQRARSYGEDEAWDDYRTVQKWADSYGKRAALTLPSTDGNTGDQRS